MAFIDIFKVQSLPGMWNSINPIIENLYSMYIEERGNKYWSNTEVKEGIISKYEMLGT